MKTISRLGAMFGRFIIGFGMMIMIPAMAFSAPPVNDNFIINSVYPSNGTVGKNLPITIKGSGFDANTRVSMSIDVGNNKAIIGSVKTPGSANSVALSATAAYVADCEYNYKDGQYYGSLQVIDISNPKKTKIIGSVNIPGCATGVSISASRAYLTARLQDVGSLHAIDISDPKNPKIIGYTEMPDGANGVTVSGNWAYVVDSIGLKIVDLSNPEKLRIVGAVRTPGSALQVSISGSIAYVSDSTDGLQVIDISDPENPKIIGSVGSGWLSYGLSISGTIAYVVAHVSLNVVDVSDPQNPEIIGDSTGTGYLKSGVSVSGSKAYVKTDIGGLQVFDVSNPSNPEMIGWVNTYKQLGGVSLSGSIAVSGSLLYVADSDGGLKVIDGNLINSDTIGSLPIEDFPHYRGVPLSDSLVCKTEDQELQIIDLSDSSTPKVISSIKMPGHATEVSVSGSTAYVAWESWADSTGGLQIIDVSNPANPKIIGAVNIPRGYAWSVSVSGSVAYVAVASDIVGVGDQGLQIFDVSESENPKIIGAVDMPYGAGAVAVSGSAAYIASGDGGLQVIDVSNPKIPKIIRSVQISGGFYKFLLLNSIIYTESFLEGIQIVDVKNPFNPVIIGTIGGGIETYGIAIKGNNALIKSPDGVLVVPLPVEVKPTLINDKTLSVTLPSPQIPGNYTIRVFSNNDDYAELIGAVTFDMPGVVSGQITDIYGNPIPGAMIRTANQDSVLSQADGTYRLNCEPGKNIITVAVAGYYEMQQMISVPKSGAASLNFRLTPITSYDSWYEPPSYQPTTEDRGSIAVGDDLTLNICARYHGLTFGLTMNFAPNPHGLNGVFWKADPATLRQTLSNSPACIDVGDDLKMNIRAEYRGIGYTFPMSFYPYPNAASASEFFWKADPASLRVIY